jgi:cell division protein FtsQ
VVQARLKRAPATVSVSPLALLFGLTLCATVLGGMWVFRVLSDPTALPIRRVILEGEFKHLATKHVQDAVASAVHGGFFSVDVGEIQRRLREEPWIRDAGIRRVWPDALHVTIVEQVAVARWGSYGLLNDCGDIFVPPARDVPRDLVQLDGPLGTEVTVLARYRKFKADLGTLGLDVDALSLSDREALSVTTTGGHRILLGRRDVDARLARFKWSYERTLRAAWERIGHVDMRYPNGFALGARQG